jgi:ABC-type transporter Mla MlaB component
MAARVHKQVATTFRFAMLRITIDENSGSVTLRLEGKLIGPWVEEVEQCWRKVFTTLGARTVLVDLSAVDFVDPAGRVLLARMQSAGFRLASGGTITRFLVQQLTPNLHQPN